MAAPLRATSTYRVNDAAVKGLLAKVGQGMYDGVTQASELIRDDAKAICPVDTDALQASITADVQRGIRSITSDPRAALNSSTFSVTGTIAPHEDYAAYVEFGTGQRGAASAGAGDGPYNPDWPGMAAQPYMRPAYDADAEKAVDIITEAVRSAIG